MQHILILSTGGTIGSAQTQAGYFSVSDDNHFNNPLNQVIETAAKDFEQHIIHEQILSLLSEKIEPQHWLLIAHTVRSAFEKHTAHQTIDKIIITHGSDTLAYTASALAFLLADLPVPILFVAALKSPNEENSDALINIRATLMCAQFDLANSVYVVFSNSEHKVGLFSALLSDNIPSYVHHLPTMENRAYATFSEAQINHTQTAPIKVDEGFKPEHWFDENELKNLSHLHIDTVKLFHVYPGLTANDMIRLLQNTPQCQVLLLNLYHSGTASSEGNNDLCPVLNYCEKNDVLVFGLPFDGFHSTGKQYESTHSLLKNGLIPLPVMSLTTAYTKLVVATHLCKNKFLNTKNAEFKRSLKKIMSTHVMGEHV